MIRLIFGALLSTAVLFGFGGWFWVASPYPNMMIKPIPAEDDLVKVLKDGLPESGVYYFPWGDQETMSGKNEEAAKKVQAKLEAGPIGQIVIRREGAKVDALYFAQGVGQYFVASLLMAILLHLALPGLGGYLPRVLFVTLAGVFASVAVTLQQPTWHHQPWLTPLYLAAYDTVSWFLAGIVMAMVVRPLRG